MTNVRCKSKCTQHWLASKRFCEWTRTEPDPCQACSQGVRRTPPNLPKGPLLVKKWTKNGVFVGWLRGVRFKKSTFWVQKILFWGVLHLPQFDPGYGLARGALPWFSHNFVKVLPRGGAVLMEGGTRICRGQDPLFFSGQSALSNLPINHQCATHVRPPPLINFWKILHF